ncbi:hypothetical protein F2Q68_00033376 [Brassica cretica]|uniref:Uncharacterized protein n=1 Tax=Brassica cretica TaxID=69181 RepID=A0A8S9H385_BRACR|nr:hypothetical protein F2Q68_00033376 [Brassica cretica]
MLQAGIQTTQMDRLRFKDSDWTGQADGNGVARRLQWRESWPGVEMDRRWDQTCWTDVSLKLDRWIEVDLRRRCLIGTDVVPDLKRKELLDINVGLLQIRQIDLLVANFWFEAD